MRKITLIICLTILTGCAATKHPTDPRDPFESYNRRTFKFNQKVDRAVYRPIAKTYRFILPSFVRKGIGNAYSNIGEIPNVANDLLQANIYRAFADTWRLIINSTLGIGGLFDIASQLGIEKNYEDLGLTFAKWGDTKSPYIVIPFLGPSTIRDLAALPLNYQFLSIYPHIYPTEVRYGLKVGELTNIRANLLKTDKLVDQAFDPYVFVRNAYLQHRSYLIDRNIHYENDSYVPAANHHTSIVKLQKPKHNKVKKAKV